MITSAKARGLEPLERMVRRRLPEASEEEVRQTVDLAVEVVETVPVLLALARQEAETQGLQDVVLPILRHAEGYFVRPVDLIPEMTQGMVGLLDDTYLVLRLLQSLERSPQPLLGCPLEEPLFFIRRLVGDEMSRRLDILSLQAMQEVEDVMVALWSRLAKQA
ncbi:MAG: DUF1232 domain-containing protein [Gemmatimonadetes bacterium]|nr:DUF1232 domain-containing protein [Gemmatimonadota bacterium]